MIENKNKILMECQNYLQAELTEARLLGITETKRIERLIAKINSVLDIKNTDNK